MGLHLALGLLIGILSSTVKNAKSIAKERAILAEARDLIDQTIKGIDAK